jgi:hypothetical protein
MEGSHSVVEIGNETLQHRHWELVERIAASQYFVSSTRLKDFLLYVAGCALKGTTEEVTEHFIGVKVFNRAPGYNSAEDSIVRTHARLLRQKLAEYFQNEGSQEEVVIEIPKGHYLPVFHSRVKSASTAPVTPAVSNGIAEPQNLVDQRHETTARSRRRLIWEITALAFGICIAGGAWAGMHWRQTGSSSPVDHFWGPFWSGDPPLVIFSNAPFVGNQFTGMRYAPSKTDPDSADYVDGYTGVGEVSGVYDLTRLFDSHHVVFTLKRSLLVTWDEARQKNLIFIGSVRENPALRVVPDDMDFVITSNGDPAIENRHPRPGEPTTFSSPEHPLTEDYAIVALIPGLEPGRKVLLLSGLRTFGTEAAVEFACQQANIEQLMHFASGPSGTVRPFEAVIKTTVGGDVPLESKLVAIHVH